MKKSLLALTTVALLAVAACGSPAPDGPVEIEFLSYNYGTPDIGGQGVADLVDAFNAQHPGIRVTPRPVATADVLTTLRAETAAGSPPAVAQIGWSKLAEAREALPITPVQDVAPPQEWADHTAGITRNVLAAVADPDGTVAAMPFGVSVPTLLYNADLFRAAGLDPDQPPRTIQEIRDAALAIRAGGTAQGAYLAVVDPGKSDYLTQSVINSAGGSAITDGRTTIDSPQAAAGLAAVAELTASGAQPAVPVSDAVALFGAGDLGMLVISTSVLAGLGNAADGVFELRTAGFPRFSDAPARPTFSGAGLAILSDDPEEQAAAWQLIRFLTSEQGYTTLTETIGYLPLRPAIVDDPAWLGDHFAADPSLLPALGQLADVAPYQTLTGPDANRAVVMLQDEAVEPIVLRGADPATTLADVAARIRELEQP